jgi:helicase MOV-10
MGFSRTFAVRMESKTHTLQYPCVLRFVVSAQQDHIGRSTEILRFIFSDKKSGEKFIITRELQIIVGSKIDHESLKSSIPYKPLKRGVRHAPVKVVVKGIKPSSFVSIPYRGNLPRADIPQDLAADLEDVSLQGLDLIQRVKAKHLPPVFDRETYGVYFKTLLWAEEKRQERVFYVLFSITTH